VVDTNEKECQSRFFLNPQFWMIVGIFILITLHYYDDQFLITFLRAPDQFLGITRHTIDRMLYLIPIILSSLIFGSRAGFIAVVASFIAMLPRAIFISLSPNTAIIETFIITLIGSLAPIKLDQYRKQGKTLELAMERLDSTQRKLHSKVRMSMEQGKQLAVIDAFSSILARSQELEQITKSALDMVTEVMQVEVVLIFSLIKDTDKLELTAFKGIENNSALALNNIRLGEGLCGYVAKTGQLMTVDDTSCIDPILYNPIMKEENLQSLLSVPLAARSRIVGTLCVATRSKRQFKDPEVRLLSALGSLIGIAIDNYHLYLDKERAIGQLKISEKKYRRLFENAHDAIWVQDLSGKISAANQAAADLFGCPLSELKGMDTQQLLSQEDFMQSKKIQDKLLAGYSMEQPYKQKITKTDGSEVILTLTTNLVSNNGYPSGLQFIARDITKEVRMQENQQFYLKQITSAHEEERLRISRDLHDSTAQSLIAALHRLEDFCRADKYLPMPSLRSLWSLHEQLKDSVQEIRRLSRDLRPSILDDLGLLPAIEWLTEQLKLEHKIETNLVVPDEDRRFAPEIEIALFRVVQEALRNIAKHSEATEVEVVVAFTDRDTKFTITDNGKGFMLPASISEFSRVGKLGIDGMQTRIRLLGGTFDIQSEPGKGTTLSVIVPA